MTPKSGNASRCFIWISSKEMSCFLILLSNVYKIKKGQIHRSSFMWNQMRNFKQEQNKYFDNVSTKHRVVEHFQVLLSSFHSSFLFLHFLPFWIIRGKLLSEICLLFRVNKTKYSRLTDGRTDRHCHILLYTIRPTCTWGSWLPCWATPRRTQSGTHARRAGGSARHPARTSSDRLDTPCPDRPSGPGWARTPWRTWRWEEEVCLRKGQRRPHHSSFLRSREILQSVEGHRDFLRLPKGRNRAHQSRNSSHLSNYYPTLL